MNVIINVLSVREQMELFGAFRAIALRLFGSLTCSPTAQVTSLFGKSARTHLIVPAREPCFYICIHAKHRETQPFQVHSAHKSQLATFRSWSSVLHARFPGLDRSRRVTMMQATSL
jgi:hypothetical protein